jgi:hypothetical protein
MSCKWVPSTCLGRSKDNDTGASHSSTRRFDEKGAELQKTQMMEGTRLALLALGNFKFSRRCRLIGP